MVLPSGPSSLCYKSTATFDGIDGRMYWPMMFAQQAGLNEPLVLIHFA